MNSNPPTAEDFKTLRADPSRLTQVHAVGPRPARRRPVTNFLKLSVVAGAIWAAGKMLSSFGSDPAALSDETPVASASASTKNKATHPSLHTTLETIEVRGATVMASIDIDDGDEHNDIVRKYQATGMRSFETAFEALTVQAEGIELRPYNAGENRSDTNVTIGIGYHIPSNVRQLGKTKVLEELTAAGIPETTAQDLVSQDPKRLAQVEITPTQGLSLLAVTMPRYKQAVVDRLGEANWRKLGRIAGPEGQAGVVWSAYNGAFWQHADRTIAAIRSGDRLEVAQSISGTARINGRSQENHNLALARAAVASRDTFHYAVGYGNREGADSRVQALVSKKHPVEITPPIQNRPPADLHATGSMMAVDIQAPTTPLPEPDIHRPTRINVDQFDGAMHQPETASPTPVNYRP